MEFDFEEKLMELELKAKEQGMTLDDIISV